MKNSLLLFVLLLIVPGASFSQQTLVRGAYLNIGTPSSMIVRWRTDSTISTVDSKIWYGTQLDTSTMMTLFDATLKTNHEINITGLTAATKYFYAVGTSTEMLSALDSTQYFKTSPPVGDSSGTVRIWAIGDFGEGNTNQGKVRDAYKSFVGNKHTDVWVWLGDNAYDDGRDNEYQTAEFDMYPNIFKNTVVWPAPGNHDYGSTHPVAPLGAGPYFSNFTMPANAEAGGFASGTESYYSYDYGNVHFISINTEEYAFGYVPPLTVNIDHLPAMLTWIENDLAANTNKDWIIAYLHATPYSRGTHTESYSGTDLIKVIDGSVMRSTRDYIVPILESYGVDVVLGGHSHVYERSYLIYGNYGSGGPNAPDSTVVNAGSGMASQCAAYKKTSTGPTPNRGTVYSVIGCSAKIGDLGSDNQLDHELHFRAAYELGSMVIEVNDNRLDAYFVDTTGSAFDEFTIIKDGTVNNAPVAVDDAATTDTSTLVSVSIQLNDSDCNGDSLTATISMGPSNGTAVVNGTSIDYTPNAGFSGADSFVYVICDDGTPIMCDTATVIVTVTPGFVGIADLVPAFEFSIHPNPFTNSFEVGYVITATGYVSLEIYNMVGQKINSIVNQEQKNGRYQYTVNESELGLTKGAYLIHFNTESSSIVQRIVRL